MAWDLCNTRQRAGDPHNLMRTQLSPLTSRGLSIHSDLLHWWGCRCGGSNHKANLTWAAGTGSTTNISVPRSLAAGDRLLTLDDYVLTCLLVSLTAATDFVSEAITFVAEGLAVLTPWNVLHQLALDIRQSVQGQLRKKGPTHINEDLPTMMHGWSCCP